jgi:hypothetical protein
MGASSKNFDSEFVLDLEAITDGRDLRPSAQRSALDADAIGI